MKRKLVWVPRVFEPNLTGAGVVTEFSLLTQAQLATIALSKGTVGPIYGEMTLMVDAPEAVDDLVSGAWGIRLKEADSAASATVFSPLADGSSTSWITWRGFSLIKTAAANVWDPREGSISKIQFVIRNPRKIQPEDELVMLLENGATSDGLVAANFWCRVGILLP